MFRQITFYLTSASLLLLLSFKHPYHLSVIKLGYKSQTKTMGIEIKMFYHDLEPAVNAFTNSGIDIKNHENAKQRDSLVFAYTREHFHVLTDDKAVAYTPGPVDFRDEYIFINLQCGEMNGKKLVVRDNMCFESEAGQTNIFHFMANGKKQTKQTVNPTAEVKFDLP